MARMCPRCDSETNTREKSVEGGTIVFERCPNCPHRTYLTTNPEGSRARSNVDMGLKYPTQKQWEKSQ